MQWITENWLLILLGGGMVAMHLFGHGKHGGKGGHDHRGAKNSARDDEADASKTTIPKSGKQTSTKPPDES